MAKILSFVLLLLAVKNSLQCSDDGDCSLNGLCLDAACVCDAGWTGTDCGALDFRPAKKDGGYNRTAENISSWGSKIVRDPVEQDLYHAFIAEFTHNCGLDYWSPYSRVIRAESRTGADGPYTFAQEIVPPFAHNPTVVYSPEDHSYLLYYIGCPQPDLSNTCEGYNFTCGPGNFLDGESGISVQQSWDLKDWTFRGQVVKGANDGAWNADVTNPSPFSLNRGQDGWRDRNEGILLAYRGCPYNCSGTEQISLAWASNFQGPYSWLNNDEPIFTNNGGAEDPFVWRDMRGNFHILMHSLEPDGGFGGGPKVGRHAYSPSIGGPWTFNNETLAYSTVVKFDDGTQIDYYRRERPQLLFSDDGRMMPLYLTTGVQEMGSNMSYSSVVPLSGGQSWWATR